MQWTRLTTRRGQAVRHASRRTTGVLLGLAAVVAATACTPEPGPTPTPSPTFTCTAAVGACTPQQAEKEAQAAKDHAAAEEALRSGLAEYYRIFGDPEAKTSTAELKRYMAEDELVSATAAIKNFRASKRVGHGSVSIARVQHQTAYPDSVQTVDVCEDGTKFYTTNERGEDRTPPGVRLEYTTTLKRLDGRWKLTQSTDAIKVSSCAE